MIIKNHKITAITLDGRIFYETNTSPVKTLMLLNTDIIFLANRSTLKEMLGYCLFENKYKIKINGFEEESSSTRNVGKKCKNRR